MSKAGPAQGAYGGSFSRTRPIRFAAGPYAVWAGLPRLPVLRLRVCCNVQGAGSATRLQQRCETFGVRSWSSSSRHYMYALGSKSYRPLLT